MLYSVLGCMVEEAEQAEQGYFVRHSLHPA